MTNATDEKLNFTIFQNKSTLLGTSTIIKTSAYKSTESIFTKGTLMKPW